MATDNTSWPDQRRGNDGAVGVSASLVSVLFPSLLQKEFPIRKITEIKVLLHGRRNFCMQPPRGRWKVVAI